MTMRGAPLFHFALLGFGLFIVSRWLGFGSGDDDTRIVVTQSQVAALVHAYEASHGVEASDAAREELIERFADEEMLLREARRGGISSNNRAVDHRLRQIMAFVAEEEHSDEALVQQGKALGFDARDAVIRNILTHNMRLLLGREGEQEPTDDEVGAYYERERDRFARPPRLTGWHVFFSKEARGAAAVADARAAREKLATQDLAPEEAVDLGDASARGPRFQGQLAHQLASRFGQGFSEVAHRVASGEWSAPVETPFGVHLVLVERRTRPQAPPLSEIRGRVIAAYQSRRRQARFATAMEDLRGRYEVVVDN